VCVDSTVRDASQRDYATVVAEDATGALSAERHRAALGTLGTVFAEITTVRDAADRCFRSTVPPT
jgi:nicotinamidase-related amidase